MGILVVRIANHDWPLVTLMKNISVEFAQISFPIGHFNAEKQCVLAQMEQPFHPLAHHYRHSPRMNIASDDVVFVAYCKCN